MIKIETFRDMALSFPDTIESPHFDKTSFRYKKRIFATLDVKNKRACVMLSPIDQSVFCAINEAIIYPVPNKWGKNGATLIELKTVKKSIVKDMLRQALAKISQSKKPDKAH